MAQQSLVQIFEDCLVRLSSGQTIEDCLRAYPAHAQQLRPLLEAGEMIHSLRVPQAELLEDQALVWQQVQAQLPARYAQRSRGYRSILQLVAAILILLLLMATTWFALTRPDLPRNEENIVIPALVTNTPTPTATSTVTPTVTTQPTETSLPTSTSSVVPSLTVTMSLTATFAPSSTLTPTALATSSPTATFAPGCGAPLSSDDAIARVAEIYPNTTVTTIQQITLFGGTPVWEILTSHRIRLVIDIACGTILTIEQLGATSEPAIGDSNSNSVEIESDSNSNSSENENSEEDNSGMGSGEDEDNSGMGS